MQKELYIRIQQQEFFAGMTYFLIMNNINSDIKRSNSDSNLINQIKDVELQDKIAFEDLTRR
jgi:hypothetical protein